MIKSVRSKYKHGGSWVAQSIKQPTLDVGSGHDLAAPEFKPASGSARTVWRLLGILSLPLSAPLLPAHPSK